MRSLWLTWLWPTILILSAIAAGLVTFVLPGIVVRPIVVMWFLFVCPGMVVIRFLGKVQFGRITLDSVSNENCQETPWKVWYKKSHHHQIQGGTNDSELL
jgi:hypothetical protein